MDKKSDNFREKSRIIRQKINIFSHINYKNLSDMGYSHTNSKGNTYYLHSKDVQLKGGRNQAIYYFAKDARSNACDLPAGKQVVESPKTGLPFVKGK